MAVALPVAEVGALLAEISAIASEMAAVTAETTAAVAAAETTAAVLPVAAETTAAAIGTSTEMVALTAETATTATFGLEAETAASTAIAAVGESATAAAITMAETASITSGEMMTEAASVLGGMGETVGMETAEGGEMIELAEFSANPITSTPLPGATAFMELPDVSAIAAETSLGATEISSTLSSATSSVLGTSLLVAGGTAAAGAVAGATSFFATSAAAGASAIASTSSSALGTSVLAASSATAATAAGSSFLGTSTATAVTTLAQKLFTALGVGAGKSVIPIIYNVVKTLEKFLPGVMAALQSALEAGKFAINGKNVLSWIGMLVRDTTVLGRLKAAGFDLTMSQDGKVYKIGSAISNVLQSNNKIEALQYEGKTVLNQLAYASPMLRNLNTDVVRTVWQAATAF